MSLNRWVFSLRRNVIFPTDLVLNIHMFEIHICLSFVKDVLAF